jgi:TolB-like protein/tetratricopeptide (TPR) repeat protein
LQLGLESGVVPGARLGPYEIVARIGAGGMGEVFRARDQRLKRDVAIKVLPASASADPDRLRRFEQEAQSASALNHPNIMAVYDVGSHDGAPYIVTELLEGETLRDRLRAGPLSPRKAADYAAQIARGLAAAHAKGIVHRDLKPENVFVTQDEHVKILDFGLAKLTAASAGAGASHRPAPDGATDPGTVLGTLAYMSPEQVKGKDVDARSDIFSFGAILYEMLSGRRAFQRESAAETASAILKEEPGGLSQTGSKFPPGLSQIVRHCLEKDPDARLQSIRDVALNLSDPSTTDPRAALPQRTVPARRRVTASLVLLVAAALAAALIVRSQRGTVAEGEGKRVAVLPFENLGAAEDDYFADGIADAIRGKLTALPGVQVIARGSSAPYGKTTKTPRQIARELGVDYLLTATVRWQKSVGGASRVAVTPELIEIPKSGAPTSKWQQPFEAALTDVFQVQADIATRVARSLGAALGTTQATRLAETPTRSLDAYDAFLKGEEASKGMGSRNIPALKQATAHYERAVALDPGFALAWARVSQAASHLYQVSVPTPELADRARDAAERAVALAAERPEGYMALGQYASVVQNDPHAALSQFARGRELAPSNAELLSATGRAEESLGRWNAALEHLRIAARLDPRSVLAHQRLGAVLFFLRRFPEARAVYDRGLLLAPDNLDMIESKVTTFLGEANLAEARAVLSAAPPEIPRASLVAYVANTIDLGWVLDASDRRLLLSLTPDAFDGDRSAWGLCLANAYELSGDRPHARVYAEEARAALEQQLRAVPGDPQRRVALGLALAYLGRRAEAIREGEQGASLLPVTKDAVMGAYLQQLLVRVYVLLGDSEKAVQRIARLLEVPSGLSPGWIRIDSNLEPLRGQARFQALAFGR